MMTENEHYTLVEQSVAAGVIAAVLLIALLLMQRVRIVMRLINESAGAVVHQVPRIEVDLE